MTPPMQNNEQAIRHWKKVIGESHVITGEAMSRYTTAVCRTKRSVPCVLRPASSEEVQAIVEIANEFSVPVYPVSCGCNWGMGSKLPVKDGNAILDLSRMNRILEVDAKHHFAIIEPGVTQRQLYEYLKQNNIPLMINVTGAPADTSLIGNALDRGVGYFTSRAESLSNMEVVLGNGRVVRTGFGHYENSVNQNIYRYGVGPDLGALFAQSNYGIVTRACFELMPKPENHLAVITKISDASKLPQFIDALAALKNRNIIQTVIHVGNRKRSEVTLAPLVHEQLKACLPGKDPEKLKQKAEAMLEKEGFGPWSAVAGIQGTPAQLRAAKKEIKQALRGIAQTLFLTDALIDAAKFVSAPLQFVPFVRDKRIMLLAVEPLYNLTRGEPTDKPVKSTYWPVGDDAHMQENDPDRSASGLLFCLPILPIDGEVVYQTMNETESVFKSYGFDAYITVNLMDTKAMECVISLGFDPEKEDQEKAAHKCIQEMEHRFMEQGHIPYRLGINSMHHILKDDSFWQTAADLKKVLDPANIIAPGNYNII